MERPSLSYLGYRESEEVANVVVDGSPNRSTVLTLTHWPGIGQPLGLGADLSAEMAFAYLDQPPDHRPARVVTNNHFDQDGLVSIFALVEPNQAIAHRELLIDLAASGDFATYRHRSAARASMALSAFSDPDRSPIGDQLHGRPYDEQCRILYEATLPLVVPMVTEPGRFRPLWAAEDERLTSSERALARGDVTVDELAEVDLAVVTIAEGQPARPGHRFGGGEVEVAEIHPMAINNATRCLRQLLVSGRRYRYLDRYETWVQYRSRRPRPRVDLRPLAARLGRLEAGAVTWTAEAPSSLMPQLWPDGESSLEPRTVTAEVVRHLQTAEPAWDPYAAQPAVAG
jgi:hypothetical protein